MAWFGRELQQLTKRLSSSSAGLPNLFELGSSLSSTAHTGRTFSSLASSAAWLRAPCSSAQGGLRQQLLADVEVIALQRLTSPRQTQQHLGLRGFAASPRPSSGPDLRQRVAAQQRTSAEQGKYLVALIVGMVGLTYASVPLYRLFCQATGFGGTVQQGETVEAKLRARAAKRDEALEAAAAEREVTVYFNADTADGMPWKFTPTQRAVKVRPGQSTLAFYTAHNKSDKAVTGVSTYNVTPQKAGYYFNKIQCFCFEEQKLRPGEKIDMPVLFYLDPEFATDVRLKGVDHLTLSYTFFKVDEEVETPQEALARIMAENPDMYSGMAPHATAAVASST